MGLHDVMVLAGSGLGDLVPIRYSAFEVLGSGFVFVARDVLVLRHKGKGSGLLVSKSE